MNSIFRPMIWALAISLVINSAHAQVTEPLVSIEALGCVPDDPTVDNGAILTAALKKFGYTLHGCPFVPRKAFYFRTPVYLPTGIQLIGAGSCNRVLGDGHWGKHRPAIARFVRQFEGPLIVIQSDHVTISDLALQGEPLPKTPPYGWRAQYKSPLIDVQSPASGTVYTRVACMAAECGWQTSGDGNHADHQTLYDCSSHACRVPYRIDGFQSTRHTLYGFIAKGSGDCVIDVRQGGFVTLYHPYYGERWDALLRLGTSSHNNAYFRVHDLHVDSSARDVRLVRETAPTAKYPQVVTIDGDIGGGATIAKDPVVTKCPSSQISVNLRSVSTAARVKWPEGN